MWDIFLLGGAEEMCSQLETWLDSPDRVNKVTRRVRNDYKWPQISNIHRTANQSWNVWSTPQLSDLSPVSACCWPFVDLCNKHRQPPPPGHCGGEGVNNLPVVPGLYFAACHKPDLWLVTQGQGPWTCLCDQSKLCVTPGATNNKYLWRCWQAQLSDNFLTRLNIQLQLQFPFFCC